MSCRTACLLGVLVLAVGVSPLACQKKAPPSAESTLGPAGQRLLAEKTVPVPGAGKPLDLRYRFDPERPVRYQMAIRTDFDITLGTAGRQKMKMDLTLVMDEKPRDGGDPALVEYAFVHQEAHMEVSAGGANVVFDIDGRTVRGSTNGIEMVNTNAGIGQEEADQILKDLDFQGKAATARCDGRGRSTPLEGDPAILEMLRNQSGGEGIFPLVLPEGPVVLGTPWWARFRMEKLEQIELREPIEGMVRFVAVAEEERDGRTLVRVRMDAPLLVEDRKAAARMQGGGPEVEMTILRLARESEGELLFDPARGVMVSGTVRATLRGELAVELGGQSATMGLQGTLHVTFEELPFPAP